MESPEITNIQKKIIDFFTPKEEVIFVYLFGSVTNKETFRDIDIAIYMDAMPNLIRQGKHQTALDNLFDYKVDLVILNELPQKNPAFAHEIVTKGELLLNKNPGIHTQYKSKVLQYYFDTAYLRDQFGNAFRQRVQDNKFGERNYE
ncbi:type VII toxin-antitoxin system MntA family adenylyltransferase antitoxin [Fodinibius sp. SL11]|uniref:type VII toxin-antitoxin system MntA family adenylyltransferase antitoxin n=1 Tax=Fodinibius sp. SL11 TaxID=3425690 RepID=UPI003F880665